jgi:hypothetical protein
MEDIHDVPVGERENVPDWAKQPGSSGQSMQPPGTPGGMAGPKITPAQRGYLLSLIEKKYVKPGQEGKIDLIMKCLRISEDPEEFGMSLPKASELIDWFKRQPDKQQAAGPKQGPHGGNPELLALCEEHGIRAGRYAVENEENILRFYSVDIPTRGNWVGWVFVKVWASDEKHPIKSFEARLAILKKIADVGAKAAMERFGRAIGQCGICGRTLTDPTSIKIGIGPICRQKSEWY